MLTSPLKKRCAIVKHCSKGYVLWPNLGTTYRYELISLIFELPYCRIQDVVEIGIAGRQAIMADRTWSQFARIHTKVRVI
jgi:hypothetical protein